MEYKQEQSKKTNVIKPIISIILGFFFYSISDATLKTITKTNLTTFEITFFHAFIIFLIASSYSFFKYKRSMFKVENYKLFLIYGICAGSVGFTNIYGFSELKLDQFYTIVFTAPLWIILLSRLILKEEMDKKTLIATILGFIVILIVMRPNGDLFNSGALATVIGTALFALGAVIVKKVKSSKKSRFLLIISSSLFTMIVSAILLKGDFSNALSNNLTLFLVSGSFSFLGAMFVFYAFQASPAAYVVAPFHYTQIIWGSLLGFMLFKDIPEVDTIIGSSILILIGIYLIYHQVKIKKASSS